MKLIQRTTQFQPRKPGQIQHHVSYYLLNGDFRSPAAQSLQSLFSSPHSSSPYYDGPLCREFHNAIATNDPSVQVLLDLPEITRSIAIQHLPEYFI